MMNRGSWRSPFSIMCFPVFYHPLYSALSLPPGHRFPLAKYQALFDRLQSLPLDFCQARVVDPALLRRVHDPAYVEGALTGSLPAAALRRIGFPWSPALIQRTLYSVGATVAAAEAALKYGCTMQISGGYHHAHRAMGSGFCLFNDLVLAAEQVLAHPGIDRVLICDLDVHQGDGSAALCSGRRDIITLSLHAERNFPSRKPPSHLDFPLPDGTGDEAYLETLEQALAMALRLYSPDLILYQAGVDIHVDDELGHLAVSSQGVRLRDRWVLGEAARHGIPIAAVPGGGYRRDWQPLIALHAGLFEEALTRFAPSRL